MSLPKLQDTAAVKLCSVFEELGRAIAVVRPDLDPSTQCNK
jgi:hypothetical protein